MPAPKKPGPVSVERALPCNIEAERAVLGAIMLNQKVIDQATDVVQPEDFFSTPHRLIFKGMTDLHEQGQGIDPVTLMDLMTREETLETVGGLVYLSQLSDGLPRSTNVEHYSQIVKEKSSLRRMVTLGENVQRLAFEQTAEASKIADLIIEMASDVAQHNGPRVRRTIRQAAISLLAELDNAKDSKILTGIPKVDECTGGFRGGELIVFTAETGAGKSFFALQVAHNACAESQHGLYCSGEMRAEHLAGRRISSDSGVAHSKIRKPSGLTPEDFSYLSMAASMCCDTCEYFDDEMTLSNIRSRVRVIGKEKIRFLIVDYDELVEVNGAKDEWDAQRRLVRGLKSLGMEMDMPVFLVSQLRKTLDKNERGHPTLQRLYGSGAKTKHASIVLYIDRPWVVDIKGDETDATIYILKNRDGRLGKTDAKFNIHTFRFEQWDKPPEEPRRSRKPKEEEDDDDL